MKITLAASAGFCFGVKRALALAMKTTGSHHTVHMLGDIVHNEDVVHDIERAGIKKIKRLGNGSGKILIIRAHGAPKSVYLRAQRAGYRIIDATCPMVREIHRIASNAQAKGYPVIIIGEKKHDEVRGIVGQLRQKPLIIESPADIPRRQLRRLRKAAIVVQSTQPLEKTAAIVAALKELIPEVLFHNTICRPTRNKQKELQTMPRDHDIMIIIGSRNSANTQRLYEISAALNPRTFLIQSADDLDPAWLVGTSSVGVTAGASTPDKTTRAVINRLHELAAAIASD